MNSEAYEAVPGIKIGTFLAPPENEYGSAVGGYPAGMRRKARGGGSASFRAEMHLKHHYNDLARYTPLYARRACNAKHIPIRGR